MRANSWNGFLLIIFLSRPLQSLAFLSPSFATLATQRQRHRVYQASTSSSSTNNSNSNISSESNVLNATLTLQHYDTLQQNYIAQNPVGKGGGTSALTFVQTQLTPQDRQNLQQALITLCTVAHDERKLDSSKGRIMLGICAENVPEALLGLKTWVTGLELPRGLLHGMDVDGVPINPEELGSVYIKYNTGGAMTFSEMRRSGMGLEALWRPGDAVVETYDGDFRGIYFNVELEDGVFRQYGILPTDLFVEDDW